MAETKLHEPEVRMPGDLCCENHIVVGKIFRHLSLPELLSCRLVNRMWHKEATAVFSKRNNSVIRIKITHPCEELQSLISALPRMSLPFTVVAIDIDLTRGDNCSHSHHEFYKEVTEALPPLKYLELRWAKVVNSCSILQFCGRVFSKNANSLEELVLHSANELEEILSDPVELPKLRTLKLKNILNLRPARSDVRSFHSRLCLFLRNAPNLAEIHGIRFSSLRSVSTVHYEAIRTFEYDTNVEQNEPELYAEFVSRQRKLGQLTVTRPPENVSTLVKIMNGNQRTLKKICFWCTDFVSTLVKCRQNGLEPLLSVETLLFLAGLGDTTTTEIRSKISTLLCSAFPNLKTAFVRNSEYGEEDYEEILENFRPYVPRLLNKSGVTRLIFTERGGWSGEPCVSLKQVSEIFPHVTCLTYDAVKHCHLESLSDIWYAWPKLRRLELLGSILGTNIDAALCGISQAEAEVLRSAPMEYLERVQLVPERPPLCFFEDLEELHIGDLTAPTCEDDLQTLSEVAGILVFRRMKAQVSITVAEATAVPNRLAEMGFMSLDSTFRRYSPDQV